MLAVGLGMLAARPKLGKTWLGLQLAIAVATADAAFLGERLKQSGRVLYYALEDSPRRLSSRLRFLLPKASPETLKRLADNLAVLYKWQGAEALRAELKRVKHSLVIIDPLLAVERQHRSRDIVGDDYRALQPLRALSQEFEVTIEAINHTRKSPGEMRDVVLGTTGVTAAVDTLWVLSHTNDGKMRRLEVTGRDVEERTLKIEFTPHGWRKVAEGAEAKVDGDLQRSILAVLHDADGPMRLQALASALAPSSSYHSVANAVGKMCRAGLLQKEGQAYSVCATSAKGG
jgi:RecA-family ATPase